MAHAVRLPCRARRRPEGRHGDAAGAHHFTGRHHAEQRAIRRRPGPLNGAERSVTFDAAERARQKRAGSPAPDARPAVAEEYWPDMEGLDQRDTVMVFELPQGT